MINYKLKYLKYKLKYIDCKYIINNNLSFYQTALLNSDSSIKKLLYYKVIKIK